MSFIDTATELLDRTEASLHSLIADALKAKAYGEIVTIAGLAEGVAAIAPGRSRGEARRGPDVALSPAVAGTEAPKAGEPSWMRPKP